MNASTSGLFSDLLVVFAVLGMLASVVMAILRLRAASQREAEQARERTALAAAYAQIAQAKAAAELRASQLRATLEGMSDGVLMTDADYRLVQWNERWEELIGVPPGVFKVGATLEDLLRAQAEAGEFGLVDVADEVARRMHRIRTAVAGEDIERVRPNGRVVRIRRQMLPDGGMVNVATDVTAQRAAAAAGRPSAGRGRPLRRCRILLVEDIVVNQVVTATQLRRDGHRVDLAESGLEALRLVQSRSYDVILMDLMMPGMGGIEATEAIRRLPGFVATVPILALTATARPQDRARCLQAGMQDVLSKPVLPETVIEAIAAVLAPGAARAMPVSGGEPVAAPPAMAPAAAPVQRLALLDTERLDDLRHGLPAGLFVQLAQDCIVDMRERMMDLHEAVETATFGRANSAAHALAGMAGSYGMSAVERRMRRIMSAAQNEDAAACRGEAMGMELELQQSEIGLLAVVSAGVA